MPYRSRFFRHLLILLLLTGCSTTSGSGSDHRGLFAQVTPVRWRQPGTWNFRVVNEQQQPIGHLIVRLTNESVGEEACDEGDWMYAVILEDKLDYDFDFALDPAYRVHGRWLTLDLTASMCNVGHVFNGEVDNEGASGFFNYYDPLGGSHLGTYTAVSVTQ